MTPRQEETKRVKEVMKGMGYKDFAVKHGTGTAHAWLTVMVSVPKPPNCECPRDEPLYYHPRCAPCAQTIRVHYSQILKAMIHKEGQIGHYEDHTLVDVSLI
jgi:hypothetical protein